jgi:hypothetical protein
MLNENRHIEKNSKELFEDVTNDIQRKLDLYEERKAEIDKIYER